uniref:Uncharacterized protein n=1 Tax=Caenorhabditis japonica TaxID=281687 RepID=A0A8R1IV63_CAEJA
MSRCHREGLLEDVCKLLDCTDEDQSKNHFICPGDLESGLITSGATNRTSICSVLMVFNGFDVLLAPDMLLSTNVRR